MRALVLVLVVAFLAWGFLRYTRNQEKRRAMEGIAAANLALERFVMERTDALTALLADRTLPPASVRARADAIVAELQARNVDGRLDAYIADTRRDIEEALAGRAANPEQ